MTKIKPLGKRVLIEPIAPETQTASGLLFVPGHEMPYKGTIVAVGDVEAVKVGDIVLFSKMASLNKIKDNETNKEYALMSIDDILAIL